MYNSESLESPLTLSAPTNPHLPTWGFGCHEPRISFTGYRLSKTIFMLTGFTEAVVTHFFFFFGGGDLISGNSWIPWHFYL